MRTIIFLLALVQAVAVYAQASGDRVGKAADVCLSLRKAVAERSADKVMQGIERIGEIPFSSLDLRPVDVDDEVSLRGHLQYSVEYLDSLLLYNLDMGLVPIEEASFMRAPSGALLCSHHAVAAGGSVTYSMSSAGVQSLLVVTEPGGMVNLYVYDTANDRKLSDAAQAGKETCRLDWNVGNKSVLNITVENKLPRDVSFIIISN